MTLERGSTAPARPPTPARTITTPTVCASVAGTLNPLALRMHSAGFEALGLDYCYLTVATDDISAVVAAARILRFRGFAISMPFKQTVIPLLDAVTPDVAQIGACNTAVADDGRLTGHNTDWRGVLGALGEVDTTTLSSAEIIGAGGAARAIAYALKRRGLRVHVVAKDPAAAMHLAEDLRLDGAAGLDGQGRSGSDLIVNATPHAGWPGGPVDLDRQPRARAVFDVVLGARTTPLIAEAERRGLLAVPGWRMLLHQGMAQFELYTGHTAPAEVMSRVLDEFMSGVAARDGDGPRR